MAENTGLIRTQGTATPEGPRVCEKTKVSCSTGWWLTSSRSEAVSRMTSIAARLAARVRDLSRPACWLRYPHVLMFGGR